MICLATQPWYGQRCTAGIPSSFLQPSPPAPPPILGEAPFGSEFEVRSGRLFPDPHHFIGVHGNRPAFDVERTQFLALDPTSDALQGLFADQYLSGRHYRLQPG